MAVARSSSGGVALRYVLPVLWMASRLAVMGATPVRVGTQRRRSTTCATRAESDVYECLFDIFWICLQARTIFVLDKQSILFAHFWNKMADDVFE